MSSIERERFKRKAKDMDTRQGNKLIAEFMGGEEEFEGDPSMGGGWRWKGVEDVPDTIIPLVTSDMCYHKSWSWLMPVIKKIRRLADQDKKVGDISIKAYIRWYETWKCALTIFASIDDVYEFCFNFIKKYSEQQNNNPLDHTPTPEESPYLYRRKEIRR